MLEMEQNSASQAADVLDALEPDQLVAAKRQPLPRRRLRRMEMLMLWTLRFYLIALLGILLYKIVSR